MPDQEPCVFCRIRDGLLPAALVLEGEHTLAFLDKTPLFHGHTLLIPRAHVATLPELPPDVLHEMMLDAQRLCRAVELGMKAQGTFVAINNRVSQTVPHLHLHVVPRSRGDGLRGFFWPRHKYNSSAEMDSAAAAIRAALNAIELS